MIPCPFDECDGSGFVVDAQERTTRECRCRPQRIAQAKAARVAGRIPKKYRGVSFDRPPVTQISPHVVGEVRRYIRDLDDNLGRGRGLWLYGDVGTGKTTLAMLISTAALSTGRSCAIYSLPRMLSVLRRTFDESSDLSYLELMDSLAAVELLQIDDLGFGRGTSVDMTDLEDDETLDDDERKLRRMVRVRELERTALSPWVLEQLYSVINARYEDEKSVVITTNLAHDALREQIGERTVSRLVEMCGDPLPLFGVDRRVQHEPSFPDPPTVRRYGEAPVHGRFGD